MNGWSWGSRSRRRVEHGRWSWTGIDLQQKQELGGNGAEIDCALPQRLRGSFGLQRLQNRAAFRRRCGLRKEQRSIGSAICA